VVAFADDVGADANYGSSTIYQIMDTWGHKKLQYITDPAGNTADLRDIEISVDDYIKRFLIGDTDMQTAAVKQFLEK
jgi:hypothetical protein